MTLSATRQEKTMLKQYLNIIRRKSLRIQKQRRENKQEERCR